MFRADHTVASISKRKVKARGTLSSAVHTRCRLRTMVWLVQGDLRRAILEAGFCLLCESSQRNEPIRTMRGANEVQRRHRQAHARR